MTAVDQQSAPPTAIETSAAVLDSPGLTVLVAEGEDASSWLQGQCTSDLRSLKEGGSQYTLFVNAKGRIVSDGWVVHRADAEDVQTRWLIVPSAAVADLTTHFERFIVMEDVEVTEASHLAVVSVQGPRAGAVVDTLTTPTSVQCACDRFGTGGVDLVCALEDRDTLRAAAVAACEVEGGGLADASTQTLAALRTATPRYGAEIGLHSYPQEAGLRDRAVAFNKGCYLGQEVICMLENRGQLSRRLVRLTVDAATLDVGQLSQQGRVVGAITTASPTGPGSHLAFAFVKRAASEPGTTLDLGDHTATVNLVVGEPQNA